MKKSKAVSEEPIGIVIATGGVAPSTPRVKAYFWFEEPGSAESSSASRSEN